LIIVSTQKSKRCGALLLIKLILRKF
jgi:hypothetical protein